MMLDENDRLLNGCLVNDPSEDAYELVAASSGRGSHVGFTTIGPDAIMAALPPIEWRLQGLRLAAGAAIALCGYGFSGKSLLAQAIALSVASGTRLFGVYSTTRGRALYVDYDGQGSRLSCERFQRLARGAGISRDQLGDRLNLAVQPELYLDDADAMDRIPRIFEGYDLVVIDALRGAAPASEENKSEIRKPIDLLNRASEKSGATVIFVHHSRKPEGQNVEESHLSPFAVRGSSAIFDACASVFMLGAKKGAPTRVRHAKCRLTGTPLDDFGYRVEDLAIGEDPRAAMRLVHLEGEQLGDGRAVETPAVASLRDRIRAELRRHREGFAGSRNDLYKAIGGKKETFLAALKSLEEDDEIAIGKSPALIALVAVIREGG